MKEVILKHPPKGPLIFKRMIKNIPPQIMKGEIVRILNKNGEFFGYAFYNPKSAIVFRTITREYIDNFDIKAYIKEKILSAAEFRKKFNLPNNETNAYRLIHDWGDGLCGLTIDMFSNCAVVEIYSYGYYLLREEIERILKEIYNDIYVYFKATSYTQTMEGFKMNFESQSKTVRIKENGIIFEIRLGEGYKSGFFLDQRENRKYLSNFAEGKTMLDLFSYTGGFGLYSKKNGAKEVTSVDLDEYAIEQLKRNANLNKLKINVVRSDVFTYMRQMIENKNEYDIVVLDPNKIITSRENKEEGIIEYIDLNKLALKLVKKNGIFLTCSCSGMLYIDEFIEIIKKSASIAKRTVKVFKKSGAGPDHPFTINYPEGEYLKAIWCFVE
ncbi:MAG: class I SAM-dependent rRNA methyltransferase [Elusimicrobiota bacterium]